jgi:hypothetical protein
LNVGHTLMNDMPLPRAAVVPPWQVWVIACAGMALHRPGSVPEETRNYGTE